MANDRLRRRREGTPSPSGSGLPMTRAELAEAVNQYIWKTSHEERHLDVDTLARYERGISRWPNAVYRDGLRAVLGVETDADLGFHATRRGKTAIPDLSAWVAGWPALRDAGDLPNPGTGMDALHRAVLSHTSTKPNRTDTTDSSAAVRQHVATAFEAYQAGRYENAAHHASAALIAVGSETGAAHATDPRVIALAYQIAAIVLSKARHTELSQLAADRGVTAAEVAGDACLRLSLMRTAAFTKAATGNRAGALATIATATGDFENQMGKTPLSASVYGTMLLTGALLAAGQGDHVRADDYLDEAQRAAQVTGTDRNDLWTAFGPSNVAIHRTNVSAAIGDMDTALATGGTLRVDHLPIERRVRLHLDVARASLAVGDREDALATLVRAEMTASSQVRHHHITRDIVTQLISSSQRRPGVELSRLAHLAGVPLTPA
ncbi:hypothetical protein [Promicromonospora soli]